MKKIYSTLALAVGLLSATTLSAENAPQSTIHHDKTEKHHEGHHAKVVGRRQYDLLERH